MKKRLWYSLTLAITRVRVHVIEHTELGRRFSCYHFTSLQPSEQIRVVIAPKTNKMKIEKERDQRELGIRRNVCKYTQSIHYWQSQDNYNRFSLINTSATIDPFMFKSVLQQQQYYSCPMQPSCVQAPCTL